MSLKKKLNLANIFQAHPSGRATQDVGLPKYGWQDRHFQARWEQGFSASARLFSTNLSTHAKIHKNMRQLQQLRCLGRYEVWENERETFLCGINRFIFMFTRNINRCNEVGSGEKLKTKKFFQISRGEKICTCNWIICLGRSQEITYLS